jgi:5-methylcytosine-specific restriction protein A
MPLSDLTASAVNEAIEEFDRLGREQFLRKYGFGRARSYVLRKEGHSYDSKAIAGAAHGYLPGQVALAPKEFFGGEATVKRILEGLGFTVDEDTNTLPSTGDVLTNEDIQRRFLVGNMGGMRRSTKRGLLVLISDPFKGLYQDRWDGEILHYTGMGPKGDQSLKYAQNRTLAESPKTKIPVHLLEALDPMKYTYAGEVEVVGAPYQEEQLDETGQTRKVWMFPIRIKNGGTIPKLTEQQARVIEESHALIARHLSMKELQDRAEKAKKKPAVRMAQTATYVRDAAVAEYTKRLAGGACDLCEKVAPFRNKRSEAYLECHHIIWLAQGGEDTIANTVALCPNCHRKMHVLNRKMDKEKLKKRAAARAPG